MKTLISNKAYRYFLLLAVALFALMMMSEISNGRFWLYDFKVMYGAADALVSGEQVYGVPFGLSTGFYKYSPFTLLFFVPFTFLDYFTASVLDFIINVIATVSVIILLDQLVRKYVVQVDRVTSFLLFGILLCGINHVVREFHLGNTNMILLCLLLLVLKNTLESRQILAGVFLAIVIFTKPYFILCGLPLLVFGYYKTIASAAISGVTFLLLSILLLGGSSGIDLYMDWFSSMVEHNSYLVSNHTLFSLFHSVTGVSIPPSYGLPLYGLVVLLFGAYFWSRRKKEGRQHFIVYFFLTVAIGPSCLITDTEHFLFAFPLIALIVFYLRRLKELGWSLAFVVLAFLYGGNSTDLFGRELSEKIDQAGILGITNLLLIGIVLFLYHSGRFQSEMSASHDPKS